MTASADLIAACASISTDVPVHRADNVMPFLKQLADALNTLATTGFGNAQTVEHRHFNAAGVAASPAINVTFQDDAAVGARVVTLADGTVDGFEKVIVVNYLNDNTLTVTPAHFNDGTSVRWAAGAGGAVVLRWDATAALWHLISREGCVVI